jgi:hypothetical protein
VIGDRLTEINVTSPTCAREIEAAFPVSVTGMLMDAIEKRLAAKLIEMRVHNASPAFPTSLNDAVSPRQPSRGLKGDGDSRS